MIRRLFILVLLLAAVAGFTQSRRTRGPRALAIVDVLSNDKARLKPVAIMVDGRFYDANLYRATPRPMAVDTDIIYDVLHEGTLIGTFTVGAVANSNGIWIADGRIKKPQLEKAPAEVTLGGKTAPKRAADDEDKPPTLRRPDSKPTGTPPGNTTSNTPPHADNTPAQPKPAETPKSSTADVDQDRPVLKRGVPQKSPDAVAEKTKPATAAAAAANKKDEKRLEVKETYTAISDANPNEYRPYDFSATPQDTERFTRDLTGMALEALNRFVASHGTAGTPVPGALQDSKLVAYDLDLNNMATVVLTASKPATPRNARTAAAPQPNLQLFVTVVARTDIYGNVRRLFTHVTDAAHLDTIPRLELIDAVDAEGTGRGQLLFRQVGERGERSFILYRVGADELISLFEGAAHH